MPAISQSAQIVIADTNTEIGTALSADSKINVYIVNKTEVSGNFRLAISASTPTGSEYLYYDFPLKASGTFIAADIYAATGDKVWVYSPAGWSARVDGVTL